MLEFRQFNSMWDRTMKEYEERATELLEAMRQRHELDLREQRAKTLDAGKRMRQSPKLLDLRRIERTLAKRGEYASAQRVKLEADELEAAEAEVAMGQREAQLVKAEAVLLSKQDQEVNALRQRIQTGAEEQRVARQQDLERLLRRYHNIKAELESQHSAERVRDRKGLSALPGALGGRGLSRAGTAGALSCNSSRAALGQSGGGSSAGRAGRPITASTDSIGAVARPANARPASAMSSMSDRPIWRG